MVALLFRAPVTRQAYWQFDVDRIAIPGMESAPACAGGCPAIADTGEQGVLAWATCYGAVVGLVCSKIVT